MMRIARFIFTNLAVQLVWSLVLSLIGIESSSVHRLIIMASLFGLRGRFLSLFISQWIAQRAVNGGVITYLRPKTQHWRLASTT